jgi:DNA-binding NarL/FixJ family response regulator
VEQSAVHDGPQTINKVRFTPREGEALYHLCWGRSNKRIAFLLSVAEGTVKTWVGSLLIGAECKTRGELCAWGLQHPTAARGDTVTVAMHDLTCECCYCGLVRSMEPPG